MEANSGKNGNNSENKNEWVIGEEAREEEEEEEEEEDEAVLKRRILGHPLYGLLIETHVNCLKVSLGEIGEVDTTIAEKMANCKLEIPNQDANATSSELDVFMEAYCTTLSKLKEAMEEQLQETTTFIKAMYNRLRELSENHPDNPEPNFST